MARKAVLAVLLMLLFAAPPAAAGSALDWTELKGLAPTTIVDIDCPTTMFCVAVDVEGDVITSSNPTGSIADWRAEDITSLSPLAIGCSSPALCVVVGEGGWIATSTNPTGGPGTWTMTRIPGVGNMGAVDCGSGICAAVDSKGHFLVSNNPTGGAGAWVIGETVGTNRFLLSAIDCPSSQLCVAVGEEMHELAGGFSVEENLVFAIRDPAGPGRQTKKTYLGPSSGLRAISCPTITLCIAVDREGASWTSDDPTGGAEAWISHFIDYRALSDVSCPTAEFCGAVDHLMALTSTQPEGGMEAWARTAVSESLTDIACPSSTLCVAGGFNELSIGVPATPIPRPQPPVEEGPRPLMPMRVDVYLTKSTVVIRGEKAWLKMTCAGAPIFCNGRAELEARVGRKHRFRRVGRSRSFSFRGEAWSFYLPIKKKFLPLLENGRKVAGRIHFFDAEMNAPFPSFPRSEWRISVRLKPFVEWGIGQNGRSATRAPH